MRLLELSPRLLGRPKVKDGSWGWRPVRSLKRAHGVQFLCPVCFQAKGDSIGVHSVICWGPEVSQDLPPRPGRWNLEGTGLKDLTLTGAKGKSNSVQLTSEGGCLAHFHVTEGEIV